jgi:hypothetical protein
MLKYENSLALMLFVGKLFPIMGTDRQLQYEEIYTL